MLHHCYAFMRMFHESLCSSTVKLRNRRAIMDTLRQHGYAVRFSDNLSFRLISCGNLDQQFQAMKDREAGQHDLHVATPGLWPATMYPEIFGVSEIWLMLLSQVIRLNHEKELAAGNDGHENPLSAQEIDDHAKALEMRILHWESSASLTVSLIASQTNETTVDVDWIALEAMLIALRHALTIYFYRRIRNVEPNLLQGTVSKVKECLTECKQSCAANRRSLQGLLWSAFVAGCEALDPELQSWYSDWFTAYKHQSSSSLGARMRQVMHEVWRQRNLDSTVPVSWWKLSETVSPRALPKHGLMV